ncbi:hypothetical protein MPLSOD_10285 [Mesorhizobium sp. SOD10]|nr:hypothetical protein MPLSOD_10285 [Mesorhizobium sp. SOD10]
MPTPREIDWFLRSEMAEFFIAFLIGPSLVRIAPVPLIETLLTLFHVFLKSAHWPSPLGLTGGGLNQSDDERRGNGFLFPPID